MEKHSWVYSIIEHGSLPPPALATLLYLSRFKTITVKKITNTDLRSCLNRVSD